MRWPCSPFVDDSSWYDLHLRLLLSPVPKLWCCIRDWSTIHVNEGSQSRHWIFSWFTDTMWSTSCHTLQSCKHSLALCVLYSILIHVYHGGLVHRDCVITIQVPILNPWPALIRVMSSVNSVTKKRWNGRSEWRQNYQHNQSLRNIRGSCDNEDIYWTIVISLMSIECWISLLLFLLYWKSLN